MANTSVVVPELDELEHPITLGISPAAWQVVAGLAGEFHQRVSRIRTKLYLRQHEGSFEVLLVDDCRLLLVRPAIELQSAPVGDFSAELDPQLFARPAPEGATLSVTPTSATNDFTVWTSDRTETASVTTHWLPPRWDHLTARVSDRALTCSTPLLRERLSEVTAKRDSPDLATVMVHPGGLTVEAQVSRHHTEIPAAAHPHSGRFHVDLNLFRMLVAHTPDDTVDVLVPDDGWGALAIRSAHAFGVVTIPDPFPRHRARLGELLAYAVAPLPTDTSGRYFVGVPTASTRIYFDLISTDTNHDPDAVQIRLRLGSDDSTETLLQLAGATPTSLNAAIDELRTIAIANTPSSQEAAPNVPAHLAHFREHLSLDECKRLLHHAHVIPITRGFATTYVADHFPGWTWNELMRVFVAAGIFINRAGAPGTCDDRVVSFHFSNPTDFHVEWVNGTEPDDVAAKREANDPKQGQYAIDAGNNVTIATLGGVDPNGQ